MSERLLYLDDLAAPVASIRGRAWAWISIRKTTARKTRHLRKFQTSVIDDCPLRGAQNGA